MSSLNSGWHWIFKVSKGFYGPFCSLSCIGWWLVYLFAFFDHSLNNSNNNDNNGTIILFENISECKNKWIKLLLLRANKLTTDARKKEVSDALRTCHIYVISSFNVTATDQKIIFQLTSDVHGKSEQRK